MKLKLQIEKVQLLPAFVETLTTSLCFSVCICKTIVSCENIKCMCEFYQLNINISTSIKPTDKLPDFYLKFENFSWIETRQQEPTWNIK